MDSYLEIAQQKLDKDKEVFNKLNVEGMSEYDYYKYFIQLDDTKYDLLENYTYSDYEFSQIEYLTPQHTFVTQTIERYIRAILSDKITNINAPKIIKEHVEERYTLENTNLDGYIQEMTKYVNLTNEIQG